LKPLSLFQRGETPWPIHVRQRVVVMHFIEFKARGNCAPNVGNISKWFTYAAKIIVEAMLALHLSDAVRRQTGDRCERLHEAWEFLGKGRVKRRLMDTGPARQRDKIGDFRADQTISGPEMMVEEGQR